MHKRRLLEGKVLVDLHILPQTDKCFDLMKPQIAPSAHNAIYDAERFLVLMVCGKIADNSVELEFK